MRLSLRDNEYLTKDSLDKLAKCSTDKLKCLWKKYNHKANNISNCLRVITENKVVLNDEDLKRLQLKRKTLYWLYFEIWMLWSERVGINKKLKT